MALVVKDRVKETTTSTGTGTITLAGATQGYQSFSVVGDGNTTYYTITNGTDWEVGIGTYSSTGPTLTRDTILESSNAGAAVNFGAGVKDVFVTYPAEKAVTLDGVETLTNKTINGSNNTITNVSLTTGVTGTLPVANGGTGATSLTSGYVLKGNGTSPVSASVIYDDGTNVGVGTTSLARTFNVASTSSLNTRLTRVGSAGGAGIEFENTAGTFAVFGTPTGSGTGAFVPTGSGVDLGSASNQWGDGYFAGNVGIGTSSPNATVSTFGGFATLEAASFNRGAMGSGIKVTLSSSFYSLLATDKPLNLGTTSAQPLLFSPDNTERMRIDTSGNVGIGSSAPDTRLYVKGAQNSLQARFSGTDSRGLEISTAANGGRNDSLIDLNADSAATSGAMSFSTDSTERMRIDSSGNVGIGRTSPTGLLHVDAGAGGTAHSIVSGGNAARLVINGDTDNSGDAGTEDGSLIFAFDGNYNTTDNSGLGNNGFRVGALNFGGSTALTFTMMNGGSDAERMRIDNSGNVGIGTTSPGGKLQSEAGASQVAVMAGGTVNAPGYPAFGFAGQVASNGGRGAGMYLPADGTLAWSTNATERMRISSSGQVGIGTSSPGSTLDVTGRARLGNGVTQVAPSATDIGSTAHTILNGTGGNALFFGQYPVAQTFAQWIQSSFTNPTTATYNIILQPLGGNVGVGLNNPGYPLAVQASSGSGAVRLVGRSSDSVSTLEFTNSAQSATQGYIQSNGNNLLFGTSTSERMRIDSSGNVGIGTSSLYTGYGSGKSLTLTNQSSLIFQNASNTWNATTAGGAVTYFSDNNLYIDAKDSTSNIIFRVNGTSDRMRITSAGNVGVGTTAPAYPLQVNGGFSAGRSTGQFISLTGDSGGNFITGTSSSGNPKSLYLTTDASSTALYLRTVNAEPIAFQTSSTERMRVDGAGNVGIGTSNPLGRLAVRAGTNQTLLFRGPVNLADGTTIYSVNDANSAVLKLEFGASLYYFAGGNVGIGTTTPNAPLAFGNAVATNGYDANKIRFYESGSSIYGIAIASSVLGYRADNHVFYTNASSPSERMRINNSGNVGIGTSAPSDRLHVREDLDGTTGILIQNRNGTGTPVAAVQFITGAFDLSDNRYAMISSSGGSSTTLQFWTGAGATPTERMRVTDAGRVGIGTTAPTELLEVYGSSPYIAINNTSETEGGIKFYDAQATTTQNATISFSSSNYLLRFYINNTERVTIDSSGNLTATGNVTAYSDARIKKDVETIDSALDLVSKMRGVRFTRIDNDTKGVGVIAQEMLEVLPEVVQQGVGDDGTLSVAYGNLVGVLIEAVKELTIRVAELEGK